MKYFMGIDAGTSGVKAIVVDEIGNAKGMGYCECNVLTPYPGWAEQRPDDWWCACDIAVKQAVGHCDDSEKIAGIGFSGQMQGTTFLDKDCNPIRNCIIWLDQRSDQEVTQINSIVSNSQALEWTANTCLNSFWAPKILWLKKNEPKNFEKLQYVVFAKDYLRYRMTGEIATEVSDASLSFLLDVANRKWSDKMVKSLGIPESILPRTLLESQDVAGTLLTSVAKEWGIRPGIPIVAGGGDQPAGGVGTGVVRAGVVGATIGTSGVVFGCTNEPLLDNKKRALMTMAHSVPDKWCFLGLTLAAGGSFKWLRDTIFMREKKELQKCGKEVYEVMTALAKKSQPGSEGLIFLPYLNGEKTPISDANARGTFFGLSYRHNLSDICRSVMEGVTFALKDTIDICREFGIDINEVIANGGGSKSKLWLQMQADIFNASIVTTNMEEGPAAGGAIMAAVGAGAYSSVQQACSAMIKETNRVYPNVRNVCIYQDYYGMYKELYPALRNAFYEQAKIVGKYL